MSFNYVPSIQSSGSNNYSIATTSVVIVGIYDQVATPRDLLTRKIDGRGMILLITLLNRQQQKEQK